MNVEEFLSEKNEWYRLFQELNIPCTTGYNRNKDTAERVLVICRGGNTRSAAVAMLLKYKYLQNALAASLEKNDDSTLRMLIKWAHLVIVTEPEHILELRTRFQGMTFPIALINLGEHRRLIVNPYEINLLKEIDKELELIYGKSSEH